MSSLLRPGWHKQDKRKNNLANRCELEPEAEHGEFFRTGSRKITFRKKMRSKRNEVADKDYSVYLFFRPLFILPTV
jgi:hypothetical protein